MKTRHSTVVESDSSRQEVVRSVPGRAQAVPVLAGDDDPVQRILRRLSEDLGPGRVERMFDHATQIRLDNGRLDVTVPNGFSAEWLDRRYGTALRRAAQAELTPDAVATGTTPDAPTDAAACPVTLHFQVSETAATADAAPAADPALSPAAPRRRHPAATRPDGAAPDRGANRSQEQVARAGHRPATRFKFDDFVVGASNRLAYSAAQRMAEDLTTQPGPLFIHGGCGLGKTHLLQALANRYLEVRPGAAVRCLTAETFTNDYISAVRNNQIEPFRKTYRGLDLLCLDDVHFLSSKEKTQSELLHTFDAINLSRARVVLASDGHPHQIERLSQGLVSRFMSGVVVRLEAPDAELRERIVAHLALRRGLMIDPAAVKLVAEHCARGGGSVREMEGVLLRVDAVQRLLPEFASSAGQVGMLAVRQALGLDASLGAGVRRAPRPIQIGTIIGEVCRFLQVDPSDLGGRGRHKRVVMARSVIAYLARKLTTLSFPEIARALSRPNHSTVITAYQRVLAALEQRGHQDLGPELGAAFAGVGLVELTERLGTAVTRAGEAR